MERLIREADADPRNLAYPIHIDGSDYTPYERGYNDGIISSWGVLSGAPTAGVLPEVRKEYLRGEWKLMPMTNADRIRTMTDEELAEFINHFNICDNRTGDECKISYCGVCEVCVLDWLREPMEEAESQ